MRRWLPAVVILAAGYVVFMAYAYPGYMSIDSAQHLTEARANHYTDWHPPTVSLLWHFVDHVIKGPLGMLLLQSLAFLAGLYCWMRRAYQPTAAAALSVFVFLFPPVVAPMAVVWKDCQMAGYLLLGMSLVLAERRRTRFAGFFLLLVGMAMRDNSPATTLPFLAFAFAWRPRSKGWGRVAAAVAIWGVMAFSTIEFNKQMTDQRTYSWYTAVASHDIAGVLKYSRRYSDAELEQLLEGTPLVVHAHIQWAVRSRYSPISWWSLLNGDGRIFNWPDTEAQRAAMARAWKQLTRDNKYAYLVHRYHVFREVLGLFDDHPLTSPMWHGIPAPDYVGPLHIQHEQTSFQIKVGDALMWIATETYLFRPHVYFFLALLLLPLAWRNRDVLALLASGIVYECSFAPFGGGDVRYSHWLTITVLVAGLVLFRRRYQRIELAAGEQPPALDGADEARAAGRP
ncbi:MAG: hypothetical protein ABI467_02535 [Kofleriaceae bacterium]